MYIAFEALFKNIAFFFINANYRRFIWLALRLSLKKRYQATSVRANGFQFHIPDAKSFIWQYHEIFTNQSYLFQTKQMHPVIYDCGANVGTSVLYLKKHYPNANIHAFEPDPTIFKYLSQNIDANKISGVTLHQAAVWTSNTTLNFASEGADAGKIEQKSQNAILIKAVDLKELLEKELHVDFLKIDIEGAEYEVLEHCSSSLDKVNNIFVECHSFLEHPQKIARVLEIFQTHGFRYYIHNESVRKSPFINQVKANSMDMQLNIFAYKN